MDCERFDRIVLDLLYDELDELTAAAARRHLEHCARCRTIASGLRATREVGALPLVDPPEGLELKILAAERSVRERLPLRQRVGRAVSVLAGYAMRPQLGMAALLLLAIGGSLVFFRALPGERDMMSVTERGIAESESESVAVMPVRSAAERAAAAHGPPLDEQRSSDAKKELAARPAAQAAPAPEAADAEGDGASAFQAALGTLARGRYREARQQFESVAARGGPDAADAALHAARAAKSEEGCAVAAPLFDQVPTRYPSTTAGYDATLEAAVCYETLGDTEKARRTYQALLDVPSHGDRARAALTQLDRVDPPIEIATKRSKAPAAGAAAPAAAPPPAKGDAATNTAPAPQQAAPPSPSKNSSDTAH